MIEGRVVGTSILVDLTIVGTDRVEKQVTFVVDTGFSGHIVLPAETVRALKLELVSSTEATLADGSEVVLDTYRANLLWDAEERQAQILVTGGEALVGMSALLGSDIRIQAVDGGRVTIEPL
jgi:clan AA aspartic protease